MCVLEDRFPLVFCVLFSFSAKQRVSDAYLRVRENPAVLCSSLFWELQGNGILKKLQFCL